MNSRHKILFTSHFLLTIFAYCQQSAVDSLSLMVDQGEIDRAILVQQQINPEGLQPGQQAAYFWNSGLVYQANNEADRALDFYLKAKKAYGKMDSLDLAAAVDLRVAGLLCNTGRADLDYHPYLDKYIAYAEKKKDPLALSKAYRLAGNAILEKNPREGLRYYDLGIVEAGKTGDTLQQATLVLNLGILYNEHLQETDTAQFYIDSAAAVFKKYNHGDYLAYANFAKASVLRNLGNHAEAINLYLHTDSLPLKEYRRNIKNYLYQNIADTYEETGDYSGALAYFKKHIATRDSISTAEQEERIIAIKGKYDVEQEQNKNLKLRQNRNIWIGALIGVALLLIIAYISYRSANQKRKLAEKENELQKEKLNKVLKEQELNGIDAMIAGQEKERQRLANDLHDNLGSILATLKLHFQNLRIRQDRLKAEEDRLMAKTDELIEEAYQKVRKIAHARNAGVPAQEGLLPAVKNFASKVSLINKLVVEVEDTGMEERLENHLELTLFRIIQELVTNIVKHADASEATIHLTNHEDSINIMVEDNGKGFDPKSVVKNEGMGLSSIQKRVEHLGGTFAIDASVNQGTTIIIDIPIAI